MSLFVKDTAPGKTFEPLPAGMHQAVCYAAIDIGTQPQFGNYPARRKVIFCWEVPDERITLERNGVPVSLPRAISAKYTLSLAAKGNLRPMLESWRGRPFTPEELAGFDLGNVVGANCFLNVVHAHGKGEKADRTYANVASVNPLAKGMPKVQPGNPVVVFSMDGQGPWEIPPEIPDWIVGLIKQSEEWQGASNPASHVPPPAQEQPLEDDIPF